MNFLTKASSNSAHVGLAVPAGGSRNFLAISLPHIPAGVPSRRKMRAKGTLSPSSLKVIFLSEKISVGFGFKRIHFRISSCHVFFGFFSFRIVFEGVSGLFGDD